MQKRVVAVFFLLVVLSSRTMYYSYSTENLAALAKEEDEFVNSKAEETSNSVENANKVKKDEILKPYLENEIQNSHWFHQILRLSEADLKEMKEVLISHNQIKLGNEGKYIKYPLHEAVRAGLATVVDLLVTLKADVNYPNYHGARPLHYVARIVGGEKEKEKALAIAKYLIAHGADPNALNNIHDTALCLAVDADFRKLVKLLYEHGAAVSSSDKFMINGSPLERAAKSANYRMINTLLKRGAENVEPAIKVVNGLLDHYSAKVDRLLADDQKIVDLNRCLQLLKGRSK